MLVNKVRGDANKAVDLAEKLTEIFTGQAAARAAPRTPTGVGGVVPGVESVEAPAEIAFGKVRVDCKALRGKRGKETFEMTPRELKVLALLFRERGNAVSRDTILNEVWGIEYYGTTRTLDQLVVKLRQKIEEIPGEPKHLLTVHTLGYRLDV